MWPSIVCTDSVAGLLVFLLCSRDLQSFFPQRVGVLISQNEGRPGGGRQLSLWGYMRNREGGAWEAQDVPGS